jgi:hypothetical protein
MSLGDQSTDDRGGGLVPLGHTAVAEFSFRRFLFGHKDNQTISVAAKCCLLAGTVWMVTIVVLHLGLLTYGAWGADEYSIISHYRDQGAGYIWFRFWSWSPRPLSEVLIWLYASAVAATKQPLIVPALTGFWLALVAAASPALFRCAPGTFAPRALGATALLAFIVLGRHVAAVFYWPIGAVAYAPVVAAFLFLFCYLANEHTRGKAGGPLLTLVLIAAACSSEPGALLVVIYSCFAALVFLRSARNDASMRPRLLWWVAPILASLFVIAMVAFNGRSTVAMLADGDNALYHHTIASIKAAIPVLPQEFVALDGETFDLRNFIRGAMVKLLFLIGMHCCWMPNDRTERADRSWLPILALSIAIAMFGMVAGSFQEFGVECCDRHAFVRQSLGFIAVAAVAIWVPPVIVALHRWRLFVAPAALVMAAVIMIHPRTKDIREDYKFFTEPARDRGLTAQSGRTAGPEMAMYLPYSDQLFPSQIPAGFHVAPDNWWTPGILSYFHKESVLILIAPTRGQNQAR